MRKYSAPQIIMFVLSFFLPPAAVWFCEGLEIDFWINIILCLLGWIPGIIHSIYIWLVWIERKWQTHHGAEVTTSPFLISSKEFEVRSRWKGNGQDGFFGYFDDNIKGGAGPNTVGGDVDLEQAKPIAGNHALSGSGATPATSNLDYTDNAPAGGVPVQSGVVGGGYEERRAVAGPVGSMGGTGTGKV